MSKTFFQITELDEVHSARSGKLSCTALHLKDGSMCLYSPVAGLEKSGKEQLNELGGVSALLAPNHYHNKGLKGHKDVFPKASLYCPEQARPRLNKITGLQFEPMEILRDNLVEGHKILEPEGLKTGEIWVEIESNQERAWVVTDAFSAPLLAPGQYGDTASTLGTFPRYGVKDAATFKSWVKRQLSIAAPTLLLPCHGSPVKAQDLGSQLLDLLDKNL
ncbi:hypothetical protein [Cohaesibacter gelatinilyticus]|uniref:Metallo-beta-lactamase domain-containing protein n=1 Tax=Cohaesibacter gelatinilyticus TaxID=372072 RepID=A0A285PH13_9HYPH|nr:hypothetical protein [Cohaesibacter gelatinilyticus]SNZ19171.1 hypothetical protein SAMN06265368_2251 [Cohaesibacter gelatinilyticus]